MRALVPAATRFVVLANPDDALFEVSMRDPEAAARAIGLQVQGLMSYGVNAAAETLAVLKGTLRGLGAPIRFRFR